MISRTIHPEVRIVDAEQGLVDYVASDETPDSYREVILAKGWRFNRFQKNAPFVDSHDYTSIEKVLGKVLSFNVQPNENTGKSQLIERVQWFIGQGHKLADLGWKMVAGGFLPAVSVGFFPIKFIAAHENGFKAIAAENGIDPNGISAIHAEQDQIELSAVVIGANPNALAKAYKADVLSDEDIDNVSEIVAQNELRKASALINHKTLQNQEHYTELLAAFRADVDSSMRRERESWLMQFQKALS